MSTGGFAAVAGYLTERFGLEPPLSRQQVYAWNKRRTVNRDGRMFPSPVAAGPEFSLDEVDSWYAAGPPAFLGDGWETPAERNSRRASREWLLRQRNARVARNKLAS
jgi:hypothetical protein